MLQLTHRLLTGYTVSNLNIYTNATVTYVCSVLVTFIGLPAQLRYAPRDWNGMIHGNITITSLLFFTRLVL